MPTCSLDDLTGGFVAQRDLLKPAQFEQAVEVVSSLDGDRIETVRLVFADQHGVLRGKTLVAAGLKAAFRDGMPITSTLLLKDTSHRTVFPVWTADAGFGEGALTGAGDVLLVPDPATFRVLPWSPHSGWILCDVVHADARRLSSPPGRC